MNTRELDNLARYAAGCMLRQIPVEVTHDGDKKPKGFPLPIKKMAPGADGLLRQEYRPLAILEYVHEVLSGEIAAQAAADRAALKKESA